MSGTLIYLLRLSVLGCGTVGALADSAPTTWVLPEVRVTASRQITTNDLIALRDIEALAVSPDAGRYAILLHQADPASNGYRTGWFIGSVSGGNLTFVGQGGVPRLMETPDGRRVGDVTGNQVRWSPDAGQIAYTALRDGEIQVWVSTVTGGAQRQLTHNAADVRDFAWSEDGKHLIYTVAETRASLQVREEEGRRRGFHLDEFQYLGYEIMNGVHPARPLSRDLAYWVVEADGTNERLAGETERQEYERVSDFSWGRGQAAGATIADMSGAAAPPVISSNGKAAWLLRDSAAETGIMPLLRIHASVDTTGSNPRRCAHEQCTSQMFSKVWWSSDGKRIVFWRKQGANLVENGFYAWSPDSGALRRIYHQDGDEFRECALVNERLICSRETVSRPAHVVSLDLAGGGLQVLADVNPEFANIGLGRIERFTWQAPRDEHGFGYTREMFGYVIHPPGFDARKRYPVFIAPYGAPGFRRGDVGDEHPLLVYAANGFVVISSQFPMPLQSLRTGSGPSQADMYSVEHGFPHLNMLMESTWKALDAIAARGYLDSQRIGIGGLSHGSFVPLHMLQRYDRLSAVAIAGPGWSQYEYYSSTRTVRALQPVTWPESREFWSQLDIADHTEEIEAPLLVNYPDREFFGDWRLPRSMENARRAYDAYIFPDEYHIKWQSAHRFAIYNRNLDWFRFWLQDIEDTDLTKAAQYERWRALRDVQCRNPRSVRNYCGVTSERSPPAR